MTYLIMLLAAMLLLAGFVALTWYEARRGARVLAPQRARLDGRMTQVNFILTRVDLAAFAREELRNIAENIGHACAYLSLQLVRSVERLLTRLVRHLRTRNAAPAAPRENVRDFVRTLSDFKGQLEARPELSEIQ